MDRRRLNRCKVLGVDFCGDLFDVWVCFFWGEEKRMSPAKEKEPLAVWWEVLLFSTACLQHNHEAGLYSQECLKNEDPVFNDLA